MAATPLVLLSFDNPVFKCFAFYGAAVIFKLLFLGLLTSYYRLTRQVIDREFGKKRLVIELWFV